MRVTKDGQVRLVQSPRSVTDGAVSAWDGTDGDLLQSSDIVIDDVVEGPASATDNAICRFDNTTGKVIQDSGVTIDDLDNLNTGNGDVNAGTGAVTAAEVNTSTIQTVLSGPPDFPGGLETDDINESTADHGVEIDSVNFKDGGITTASGGAIDHTAADFFRIPEGTSFPSTPPDWAEFRRTDLDGLVFFYDGDRGAWLSKDMFTVQWGRNVTGMATNFLGFSVLMTSNGWIVPYDITVVGLDCCWVTSSSGSFNIRSPSTFDVTLNFSSTTYGYSHGVDQDYGAGTHIRVSANGFSPNIDYPRALLHYRRRET